VTAGVAPPRNASVGLCLGAGLNRRGARRSDADRPARRRLSCKASCRTTRPAPTLSWPAKVAAHQGVESAVLGRPASQVSTTPACAPAEIFGRPVMKIMKTYRLRARRGHRDMALMVMPVTSAAGADRGLGAVEDRGDAGQELPLLHRAPRGHRLTSPAGPAPCRSSRPWLVRQRARCRLLPSGPHRQAPESSHRKALGHERYPWAS